MASKVATFKLLTMIQFQSQIFIYIIYIWSLGTQGHYFCTQDATTNHCSRSLRRYLKKLGLWPNKSILCVVENILKTVLLLPFEH